MAKITAAERAHFEVVCIIANNITDAAKRFNNEPTYPRMKFEMRPKYRIKYAIPGVEEQFATTAPTYDLPLATEALGRARLTVRAWLQETIDDGRVWRTLGI